MSARTPLFLRTLPFAILCVWHYALAQPVPGNGITFKTSSSSSITLTRDTVEGQEMVDQKITTASYHVVTDWQDDGSHTLLIREVSTQHMNSGQEAEDGTILFEVYSATDNFHKAIWKKTVEANLATYTDSYLQVTQYGCCAADNGNILYRYTDGKMLMKLSSELGVVDIPNQHSKRYIGALSANAALPNREVDTNQTLVAVVTYLDPQSLKKDEAIIYTKHHRDSANFDIPFLVDFNFTPETSKDSESYYGKNELSLWSAKNATDYARFTVNITFESDDREVLRIPIRNDKMDLSQIRSDWFSVERRKSH